MTIAEHLEQLRDAMARRLGGVPGIGHGDAIEEQLLDAVDRVRRLNLGDLENCRQDVGHVVELLAQAADVLDIAIRRSTK